MKTATTEPKTGSVPGSPRIAYDSIGDGDAVVFLHGVGGWRRNWSEQLPLFGQTHLAVAWDARGYAQSEDYSGNIAIADFSSDLVRLLDHLGKSKVHLVGLSMGGFIAQDFYHRYGGRVKSLTLADTAVSLRATQGDAWTSEFVRMRREPLERGITMAELAPELAKALVHGGSNAASFPKAVESLAIQRTGSYLKALQAVAQFDNPLNHSTVTVPTLVIVGTQDKLTPMASARDLAQRIPGSRYLELDDAGHLSNMDVPLAFNAAVLSFIRDAESVSSKARASTVH